MLKPVKEIFIDDDKARDLVARRKRSNFTGWAKPRSNFYDTINRRAEYTIIAAYKPYVKGMVVLSGTTTVIAAAAPTLVVSAAYARVVAANVGTRLTLASGAIVRWGDDAVDLGVGLLGGETGRFNIGSARMEIVGNSRHIMKESGKLIDDGLSLFSSKLSRFGGEAARLTSKTIVTPEMQSKILLGQRVAGSNRLIGGHSGIISNAIEGYAVETLRTFPNGTRSVKFITQFADGNLSKIKKSTLFPKRWTDSKIIDIIIKTGNSPALRSQVSNHATVHQSVFEGVRVQVFKIGDKVISANPVGF